MAEKFYLDTSIWLDLYEKRGENGESAFKLIKKIIEEGKIIGYSNLNIEELKNLGYAESEIGNIFDIVKPANMRKLYIHKDQILEASKISRMKNIPRKDVLQAILSRDNDFQLISRDKHFERLKDITIVKLPEDFI